MTPECEARWYAHTWSQPEQCRAPACTVIEGNRLCWTHAVTVEAGLATLDEVLSGERKPVTVETRDPCDDLESRFG